MPPQDSSRSEREQTDDSLRKEREKADLALGSTVAAVDDLADSVVAVARARADALLARSRARNVAGADPSPVAVASEQARADENLTRERAAADAIVHAQRSDRDVLAAKRDETDSDLRVERDRSDAALATRDEFLSIVSHDLRNLLSSVVGSAALIAKTAAEADQAEPRLRAAERIARAGTRMSRLIGDLVDVASIEAGVLAITREDSDPCQVVDEVVETFQALAAANSVTLAAELVPRPPIGRFDPARILQVLANLVGNAIKFTRATGRIVVRAEADGEDLLFSVTDTGAGIPSDKHELVFGRFVQVASGDRRGVGLGLYIAKCIVEGHRGKIWIDSVLGRGTVVRFRIPRV